MYYFSLEKSMLTSIIMYFIHYCLFSFHWRRNLPLYNIFKPLNDYLNNKLKCTSYSIYYVKETQPHQLPFEIRSSPAILFQPPPPRTRSATWWKPRTSCARSRSGGESRSDQTIKNYYYSFFENRKSKVSWSLLVNTLTCQPVMKLL